MIVCAPRREIRRGEVLGLTWSAVDLDGGAIRVERTLVRLNREFSLAQPKTQQSRRAVAIPDAVVRVLRSHRVRQLEGKLGAATWRNEWDLVFTREDGTPIEPRWLHTQFVGLLDAAGVRRVRFHDLRHGAATVLLLRGVPMKVVQDVLGHSQMKMTSDLYSHVLPELRREAADQMGAALFGH